MAESPRVSARWIFSLDGVREWFHKAKMLPRIVLAGIMIVNSALFTEGSERRGFVSVQEKQLATPDGKPLLLRGINLGNWLVPEGYMFKIEKATSPRLLQNLVTELVGPEGAREFWRKFEDAYIRREDIQFIKQRGFNSIRVPFNYRSFMTDAHPAVWLERGFELLDRVLGWSKEAGLWVILDLHCAPGGQTGDNIDDSWGYPWLFESAENRERTATLWRRIAERYRSEPTVIAYDLLNEPIAHFFNTEKLNPLLEPVYKQIVKAIREVDSEHLVIIEGAQWGSKFDSFGPPFDSKLVYSFHKYWTAPDQSVVQEYVDFGEKHKVPLYMGESGENTDEWITQFRKTLETNRIGWCFWPYKKLEATSGVVSIRMPEHWSEIITYASAPRDSFEALRKARDAAPKASRALEGFLDHCRFEKCVVNEGYLKALGL
jgi:aryl-phospho-beta-D-glucosidase BglC (GH1 family)